MDKDLFLKARLPERILEMEYGDIRVRALSRDESAQIRALQTDDVAKLERTIIGMALVDPVLTDSEIRLFYGNVTPGEVDLIIGAIQELSGLAGTAPSPKRSVSEVGD